MAVSYFSPLPLGVFGACELDSLLLSTSALVIFSSISVLIASSAIWLNRCFAPSPFNPFRYARSAWLYMAGICSRDIMCFIR